MARRHLPVSDRGGLYGPKERSNWKDHPLAVATLAATGTAVFMSTVVMPLNTTHLNNRIAAMTDKVTVAEEKTAKVAEIEKKLKDTESQLAKTEGELAAALNANLFSQGNPYPNGLQAIKIGDSVDMIFKAYPSDAVTHNELGYYSVKTKHPVFDSVTYYHDDNKDTPKITHIGLFVDYKLRSGDLLQRKLNDALGEPKKWKVADYYSWATNTGLVAYKSNDTHYVIMKKGSVLSTWPRE